MSFSAFKIITLYLKWWFKFIGESTTMQILQMLFVTSVTNGIFDHQCRSQQRSFLWFPPDSNLWTETMILALEPHGPRKWKVKKKHPGVWISFSPKEACFGIISLVSSSKFFRNRSGITLQNNRMMSTIKTYLLTNLPTLITQEI